MSMMQPIPRPQQVRQQRHRPTSSFATLQITLADAADPVADVAFVIDALDSIVTGSIRASLLAAELDELLAAVLGTFSNIELPADAPPAFDIQRPPAFEEYDAKDPYTVSIENAVNAWFRRVLLLKDPDLYNAVFRFATITEARLESPLLIELTVALGAAAVPAVVAIATMYAAFAGRKFEAEASIRETEAQLKQEELKQRKLQTQVLQFIVEAANEKAIAGDLQIPESVLTAAATITSPAVADLGNKALVEKLSFSVGPAH